MQRALQAATAFTEHIRAIYDKGGVGCQPLTSVTLGWYLADGATAAADGSAALTTTPTVATGTYPVSGMTPTIPGDYYLLGKGQDDSSREVYFEAGPFSVTVSGLPAVDEQALNGTKYGTETNPGGMATSVKLSQDMASGQLPEVSLDVSGNSPGSPGGLLTSDRRSDSGCVIISIFGAGLPALAAYAVNSDGNSYITDTSIQADAAAALADRFGDATTKPAANVVPATVIAAKTDVQVTVNPTVLSDGSVTAIKSGLATATNVSDGTATVLGAIAGIGGTLASGTVGTPLGSAGAWVGFTCPTSGITGVLPSEGLITLAGVQYKFTAVIVGSTATIDFTTPITTQPAGTWSIYPKVYSANPANVANITTNNTSVVSQ